MTSPRGQRAGDARIVLLDDVDDALIPPGAGAIERAVGPSAASANSAARRQVADALRAFRPDAAAPRVLVVTSRDLVKRGLHRLYGFSDRRRRVAIVSTFQLGSDPARVANVIAHELGHLDGLRHCRTPGCLMSPARSVHDIDARAGRPCGSCPRALGSLVARAGRAGVAASLAGVTACAMVFAGLDLVERLLNPPPKAPFRCGPAASDGTAPLVFDGVPVLASDGSGGRQAIPCRSAATPDMLNRMFRDVRPPALEIAALGPGHALVRHGQATVVEVGIPDAAGQDPSLVASRWAGEIRRLVRAKGAPTEVCPECHVSRADEVERVARRKGRF
jgi:hypothetical protein